ncbi:PREDICTED: E3 ubiquitin-protein ligase SIAH1-like [Papilio polytes]|uniref:E3 ubiquitin-protein ligase SIAH1-like n=1 Tax=Papilio polytes TaxID=76194 RepID=UPI000675D084|nr:PREDICTED: E3 ubiquitin-protein ligase SIAH1-like [Papilio polytes]
MAKAKVGKKTTGIAMELPECPVCFETMSAPIFQCQSGHSLCNSCTSNLCPPICPICRQAMTQMRNLTLEDVIAKANVPCPNKSLGCVYTMLTQEVDDHLKECIFRVMTCPLGAVFGKCSWTGNLKEMMDHFKDRHPQHCNINMETGVELNNVSINEDERFLYLAQQGNLLFIVTMKIDTLQKVAYWVVQHIGSKKSAQQHIYEVHITSKQDPRRQVIFIDHCYNDILSADAVYRLGKCGILPLDMFSHFIHNKKCSFKFVIKKGTPKPKKFDKSNTSNENKQPNAPKHPKPKAGFTQRNKSPGPAKHHNVGSKK